MLVPLRKMWCLSETNIDGFFLSSLILQIGSKKNVTARKAFTTWQAVHTCMIWYFASSVLIRTCANFCTGSLETHPKPRNRTSASCAFSRFFTFTILLTSEYSQRQYLARILKFCFPSLENRKILYDVQ